MGTPPERGILTMVTMLVHPCACREHATYWVSDYTHPGTPPHMRGIPLRPLAHSDATEPPPRIAGNAPFTIQEETTLHRRGAHHFSTVGAAIVRHTPAYARSTHSSGSTRRLARDHPRICGEHEQYLIACSTVPGSTPRMQGTLSGLNAGRAAVLFTPAYAGST